MIFFYTKNLFTKFFCLLLAFYVWLFSTQYTVRLCDTIFCPFLLCLLLLLLFFIRNCFRYNFVLCRSFSFNSICSVLVFFTVGFNLILFYFININLYFILFTRRLRLLSVRLICHKSIFILLFSFKSQIIEFYFSLSRDSSVIHVSVRRNEWSVFFHCSSVDTAPYGKCYSS